jgi:quinol monooxygenase YgiN
LGKPSFAIIVQFALAPGTRDRFLALVRDNATTSVRDEPGCHRFDVLVPAAEDEVVLYEIYADAAAFDIHLASPHFADFDRATSDMVRSKAVTRFALDEHAKA